MMIDKDYDNLRDPVTSNRAPSRLFSWLAAGAAVAATYYLGAFGVAWAHMNLNAAGWRHLAFVGIDTVLSLLVFLRPRWLVVPVAIVAAQALWSNGQGCWVSLRDARHVDWISLTVLLYIPILLGAAIWNTRLPSRKGFEQ